ncbi:MAG: hypothetical protein ACMUHY_01130 [Thermoplasmatota archaeon]
MRIGDVGTVSPVGDLLAFSLSVLIVFSIIYGVRTSGADEEISNATDWVSTMVIIKEWEGFDPDHDGLIEPWNLDSGMGGDLPVFPFEEETMVTFRSDQRISHYHFVEGSIQPSTDDLLETSIVHGCPVLLDIDQVIRPGTMEISIFPGDGI